MGTFGRVRRLLAGRVLLWSKERIDRMMHRLAHWLGLNFGRVETWFSSDGRLMVAFRCAACGSLSHVHERDGDIL